MNIQNKILTTLFALGTMLWGCDSLIYEDMKNCPQGVYVKFYSMTPCAVDSTFIGQVSDLHLFAFNEKDVLVSASTKKNVNLDKNNQTLVPVTKGYYSFIGWAGVNEKFTVISFKEGITTKKDVMLILKSQSKQAEALGNHQVWQGTSPVVYLQDPAVVGSEYKHTTVNLQEKTNRVNAEIELHKSILKDADPKDFMVEITSANGTMNIDGSMPLKTDVLTYPSVITYTDKSVKAQFSLMDLKTGYSNLITVRNVRTKEVIWQSDLIGSILLKNPDVNLECKHDFDVKFVIKDKCLDCGTYICWSIFVNEWQIHSYETELGDEY
ncbi:FimB/Mfa2 family fimbrial subunit [Bacteroides pyogenes]|uniref:FimB/Mfa2 family fimbrial subunit n=1 Tax=Bacteroides pyogenes TaxID=310300 RepID=UPI002A8311F9|nr:FimB/Mfa2 family fimbrial subunit [Bacteroides pyogenes]MDY4250261.1 FimB/Mfa2 family fimbrial subunit [Bacteroides pyogenes]